jgi:benzoyl-CoA reductase/2-hydroxyglutaryl-CoA dehydratase subunit BcrC/BadD/HgdB
MIRVRISPSLVCERTQGGIMTYNEAIEQSEQGLKQMIEEGQSILGYMYPHAPLELILAHGLTPTLISALPEVSGAYEASLQTFACAFARNLFSQRVREEMVQFAGLLFPGNTCDSLQNVGDVWRIRFPEDILFRLTYPVGDLGEASVQYLTEELRKLDAAFENTFGSKASESDLKEAISLVSEFNNHSQFLYAARVLKPDLIPYSRLANLVRSFLSIPRQSIVEEIRAEAVSIRSMLEDSKKLELALKIQLALLEQNFKLLSIPDDLSHPRIVVAGGMVEPQAVASLINNIPEIPEDILILDLLSMGFKAICRKSPGLEGDFFEEMARAILSAPKEPTQEGLPERLTFLKSILTTFKVDGLVICENSFCDPDEFEAPALETTASEVGVSSVRLPMDPELSDRGRLEGRLQSFVETLEHK